MRIILLAATLALSACVDSRPLDVPRDHPGHPKAPAGPVAVQGALEGYRTPSDFAARAAEDAKAPAGGGHAHGGMQHGSAPQGAASR